MPYLFLAALGLTAFIVLVPFLLLGMYLALWGGAAWAFVVAARTLLNKPGWQPALVTPDEVVNGAVLRTQRGPFARDWAWPSYLAAQWRRDFVAAWRNGRYFTATAWRRAFARISTIGWPPLRGTLEIGGPITGAIITLGALAGGALVLLLGGATLVLAWVGWALVIGTLRGYDRMLRAARRASGSCPSCYHVMAVPVYRCPACGVRHRDIRPGLLGAAWRRCGCGARLPTTVFRASWLDALCQRCAHPLREGSAAVTDIRMPVLGPISAGKTRLVRAGLVALHDRVTAEGAEWEFVDDTSHQVFQDGKHLIAHGGDTVKTPAGQLPSAITVRITKGRRRALLHFFDAAGEFYLDREDNSELEFLDHAGTMVFVLDPFSTAWVRDRLGSSLESRLIEASPANADPDHVYRVTTQRLRDYGVDTTRRALAITVVKADLLSDQPWAADLCAGEVRPWLNTAGLDNLVLAAERDFAEVEFFVASSVTGVRSGGVQSPADTFLWLLERGGFTSIGGRKRGGAG